MANDIVDSTTCFHHRISNDTWECVACGARMLAQRIDTDTVLSAPNLAACTNPACQAALADGTYDDTNPPAGCTNRHGLYVPDRARERRVPIGYKFTYECDRCEYDATIFTRDYTHWECGKAHRGEYVRAAAATNA